MTHIYKQYKNQFSYIFMVNNNSIDDYVTTLVIS